jgi:hypothetical protein
MACRRINVAQNKLRAGIKREKHRIKNQAASALAGASSSDNRRRNVRRANVDSVAMRGAAWREAWHQW